MGTTPDDSTMDINDFPTAEEAKRWKHKESIARARLERAFRFRPTLSDRAYSMSLERYPSAPNQEYPPYYPARTWLQKEDMSCFPAMIAEGPKTAVVNDMLEDLGNGIPGRGFDGTCTGHRDGNWCIQCRMTKALLPYASQDVALHHDNGKLCVVHLLLESGRARGDQQVLSNIWTSPDKSEDLFRWYWRNGGYECMLLTDAESMPRRSELVYQAEIEQKDSVRRLAQASYDAYIEIRAAVKTHLLNELTGIVADYVSCFVVEILPEAEKLYPLSM